MLQHSEKAAQFLYAMFTARALVSGQFHKQLSHCAQELVCESWLPHPLYKDEQSAV